MAPLVVLLVLGLVAWGSSRVRRSAASSRAPGDYPIPGGVRPVDWPGPVPPQPIPRDNPSDWGWKPKLIPRELLTGPEWSDHWLLYPDEVTNIPRSLREVAKHVLVATRVIELAVQLDIPASIDAAGIEEILRKLVTWQFLTVYEHAADLPADFPHAASPRTDAPGRFWFQGLPDKVISMRRPDAFTFVWVRHGYMA